MLKDDQKAVDGWVTGALLLRNTDFHDFAADSHRIGGNAGAGAIEPAASLKAESPAMPGAGHGFIVHQAIGERGALVWAGIVDRVIGPFGAEDGDEPTGDFYGHANVVGDVSELAGRVILIGVVAHGGIFSE